ncbi:TPA: hypothetical protein JLG68_001363 [Escherichia coli]|nr:hypothetical protein [Escherichia coli]
MYRKNTGSIEELNSFIQQVTSDPTKQYSVEIRSMWGNVSEWGEEYKGLLPGHVSYVFGEAGQRDSLVYKPEGYMK